MVAVIAWSRVEGRADEIAAALSGASFVFYPFPDRQGVLAKLTRYALGSLSTAAYLAKERPRAVIVTNPPVFPSLISYAYARVMGVPVIIDGHPGSFGLKEDRIGTLMLPVTRWLTPRVTATLVTGVDLGSIVESWGGRAAIAHEAPPREMPSEPGKPDWNAVLFVSTFSPDEPVSNVLAAAALMPDVDFRITGDRSRAQRFASMTPGNVKFLGYLGPRDYAGELARASVVLALTDEPTSVLRAGYEAVYALRPLIVSDTAALREAFPHALYTRHDPKSLASSIDRALAAPLDRVSDEARAAQIRRWQDQLSELQNLIRHP